MYRIASANILALALLLACKGGSAGSEMRSIILEPGEQSLVTLRVGQRATCAADVHGSVGKTAEGESADPAILALVDSTIAYLHPGNMQPGMTGGDAATHNFVFEARAPGATTITLRRLYRGNPEETKVWQVRVEK